MTYINHYENEEAFDRLTHGAGPCLLSMSCHHLMNFLSNQCNLRLDSTLARRHTATDGFAQWGEALAEVVEQELDTESTEFAKKRKSKRNAAGAEYEGDEDDEVLTIGDDEDMEDFTSKPRMPVSDRSCRQILKQLEDLTQDDPEEIEISDDSSDDVKVLENPEGMTEEQGMKMWMKLDKRSKRLANVLSNSAKTIAIANKHNDILMKKMNNLEEQGIIKPKAQVKHVSSTESELPKPKQSETGDLSFEDDNSVKNSQLIDAEQTMIVEEPDDKDKQIQALQLEKDILFGQLQKVTADPYAHALTKKNLIELRCKDLLSAFLKFKKEETPERRADLEQAEKGLDNTCDTEHGPSNCSYQVKDGTVDKLKNLVVKGVITPMLSFTKEVKHRTGIDGARKEMPVYLYSVLEIKPEDEEEKKRLEQDVEMVDYDPGDGELPADFEKKLRAIKKEEEEQRLKEEEERLLGPNNNPTVSTEDDNMETEDVQLKLTRGCGRGHSSARTSLSLHQPNAQQPQVDMCKESASTGVRCLGPAVKSASAKDFSEHDLAAIGIDGTDHKADKKKKKSGDVDSKGSEKHPPTRSTHSTSHQSAK